MTENRDEPERLPVSRFELWLLGKLLEEAAEQQAALMDMFPQPRKAKLPPKDKEWLEVDDG